MARLNSSIHPALNNDLLKILEKRNIINVIDFLSEKIHKLQKITSLTLKDINKIREIIFTIYGGINKDPIDLWENEKKLLSTGIASLDDLLNGGIYSSQVYEICGTSSSGKSQLCLTLVANISHKTDYEIIYIDTKNDFSSSRILQIFNEKNLDDQKITEIMNRLQVCPVKNINQLLNILHNISSEKLKKNMKNLKLIIIDSLPSIFHFEMEKQDSSYNLNCLANISRYLVNEFNMTIITTNLISHWRETEGFGSSLNDSIAIDLKPTLGKYWQHVPNVRIFIEHYANEKRKISLWKSYDTSINKVIEIDITNSGIN